MSMMNNDIIQLPNIIFILQGNDASKRLQTHKLK